MSKVLCGHRREECCKDSRIRTKSTERDEEYDQMTLKEYIDPFTGEPVIKGN